MIAKPQFQSQVVFWCGQEQRSSASNMSETAQFHRQQAAAAARRSDWLRAVVELERACQLEPNDFDTRYQLAVALASSARCGQALRELNLLVERDPRPKSLLLRGDVLRALGEAAQAADDYRLAHQHQPLSPRRQLLLVEVLLNSNQPEAAGEILRELPPEDSACWRLAASAVALANGQHEQALRDLSEVAASGPPLSDQALRRMLAFAATDPGIGGMVEALERVPDDMRDDVYWLLRGNVSLAAGAKDQALMAWSRVTQVSPTLRHSREALARQVLSSQEDQLAAPLTIDGMMAVAREKVASLLAARTVVSNWIDPGTGHNLAVFHLAEGNRRAEDGDYKGAVSDWNRSIAFAGLTLSDTASMCRWASRRCQAYQAALPSRPATLIKGYVVQHYEWCFDKWSRHLIKSERHDEAARVADLTLVLRAEMRAVELLQSIGGVPLGESGERISVGPELAALMGLQSPLSEFLSGLPVKRSREPRELPAADADGGQWMDVLLDFDADDEDPAAVDGETKLELERLFGGLKLAAVLDASGETSAALKRLGALKTDRQLAAAVNQFEVSLLLKLAEQNIISQPMEIDGALAHWRQALALIPAGDDREQAASRINAFAAGRARSLIDSNEVDDAIELLEAVNGLGHASVARDLAHALAHRGIQQGNAGDWEQSVSDLRRAREFDRESWRANSNLITALHGLAAVCCLADRPRTCALLQEAREVVGQCLEVRATDVELLKVQETLEDEIASMCDFTVDVDLDNRLNDILSFDDE